MGLPFPLRVKGGERDKYKKRPRSIQTLDTMPRGVIALLSRRERDIADLYFVLIANFYLTA